VSLAALRYDEQQFDEAARLARSVAHRPEAQGILGKLHEEGVGGCPKDLAAAAEFYREGAKHGR
jgi:TPR repeat protein